LLLMIGEYYNILFSINATVKSLIEFLKGNSSLNFLQLLTEPSFLNLYFFVVGVLLGIVGFSKFIDFMLKKYKGITLFFIDGIVVISLLQILMNIFPVINTFIEKLVIR
ncbi:MAG: undecaprenyl phosphate translocase family protein, partial [Fusobacteriaceae bacterium]